TLRTRRRARRRLNRWLAGFTAAKNHESSSRVLILDEGVVGRTRANRFRLGAYYLTAASIHPTVFSRCLAAAVAERLQALALSRTKLVITDLDNTLWHGVIGEHADVSHDHHRQQILKRLKEKGVVLAI